MTHPIGSVGERGSGETLPRPFPWRSDRKRETEAGPWRFPEGGKIVWKAHQNIRQILSFFWQRHNDASSCGSISDVLSCLALMLPKLGWWIAVHYSFRVCQSICDTDHYTILGGREHIIPIESLPFEKSKRWFHFHKYNLNGLCRPIQSVRMETTDLKFHILLDGGRKPEKEEELVMGIENLHFRNS